MKTQTASQPWSWLSPEDAVRHALAAYYGACRDAERDAAEHENGSATAELRTSWWLDELCRGFVGRAEAQAIAAGLPGLTETPAFGGGYLNANEYVDNRGG